MSVRDRPELVVRGTVMVDVIGASVDESGGRTEVELLRAVSVENVEDAIELLGAGFIDEDPSLGTLMMLELVGGDEEDWTTVEDVYVVEPPDAGFFILLLPSPGPGCAPAGGFAGLPLAHASNEKAYTFILSKSISVLILGRYIKAHVGGFFAS